MLNKLAAVAVVLTYSNKIKNNNQASKVWSWHRTHLTFINIWLVFGLFFNTRLILISYKHTPRKMSRIIELTISGHLKIFCFCSISRTVQYLIYLIYIYQVIVLSSFLIVISDLIGWWASVYVSLASLIINKQT